jgi:hypothetical protein
MVQIELSEPDAGALRAALESYLSDLRMEIANTDRMDFRESLKSTKAALERVVDALEPPRAQ